MATPDIDFGNTNTPVNNGSVNVAENAEEINNVPQNEEQNEESNSDDDYDYIEYEGVRYHHDDDGNLVDDDGKIFKTFEELEEWSKQQEEVEEDEDELSINNIQKAFGIELVDENDQPLQFENSPKGVAEYINEVISQQTNTIQEATINQLYNDIPYLKDFINYVKVNGSYVGFGQMPDRRGITLNKDDEQQLIAVLKVAAKEFNNPTINDTYIEFLRQNGSLYDEAKAQLDALANKDKQDRELLEQQAIQKEQERQQALDEYYNLLYTTIQNKKIGDYTLPDNVIRNINGKKYNANLQDFFDYIAKPRNIDGQSLTDYQRDIAGKTQSERMNKQLLDAWLTFTGGSYKDLVNMAINEENVRVLKLRAKKASENQTTTLRLKPKDKVNVNDIIL